MIRLLYWVFVAVDIAGLLFFFVLGLAAAGSAKTHPLLVALFMLGLPGLVLVLSIGIFLRSSSPLWRGLAFVLVAAPLLMAVATKAVNDALIGANSNAQGELTFFRQGPQRDLIEAIRRNDAPAVQSLVTRVNVNASGLQEMTPLVMALRQLRTTPAQQEVLEVLLAAGADPNQGTPYERPLEMALQIDDKTGPDPVARLLARGANPNVKNAFGVPIWFAAAGHGSGVETLALMLERGADPRATGSGGETILFYAASAGNWRAVRYLLAHSADASQGRSVNGLTFRELVEKEVRERAARDGYAGAKRDYDGLQDVVNDLKRP